MSTPGDGAVTQVIISVSRSGDGQVHDIEVPATMQAGQLAKLIARSMGWGSDAASRSLRYRVEVHPLGRVLAEAETLAEAGVWDGAWLVLQPLGPEPASAPEPPRAQHSAAGERGAPVVRWRPLSPAPGKEQR
jgi:hypothetical protein